MRFFWLFSLVVFLGCPLTIKKNRFGAGTDNLLFSYENIESSPFSRPLAPKFLLCNYTIKGTSVYDVEDNYIFKIDMDQEIAKSDNIKLAWGPILFDIYLNFGDGKHLQTLKDRNVKIEGGWDKAIFISPTSLSISTKELSRSREVYDSYSLVENVIPDTNIAENIEIEGNSIYIKVPKEEGKELKSFQIFSLGMDLNQVDEGEAIEVLTIKELSTKNTFGGGSNSKSSPNVAHILGSSSQLQEFKSSPNKKKFPSVSMIDIKRR